MDFPFTKQRYDEYQINKRNEEILPEVSDKKWLSLLEKTNI
jgi:hypothetical protein